MRVSLRVFIIFLSVILISLGRAAPSLSKTETASPSRPVQPIERIVLPLSAAPETLNPYLAWDNTEKLIDGLVYESLLSFDSSSGEISPGLAAQWTVDTENLLYTFYLKPDVRWQDGKPFTASDVVFSFNKVMDPDTFSAHLRSYYQDIKEITAPDELTVQIRLKRPYYLALEALGGLPIIPLHLFEDGDFNASPYNLTPMGTGPYKMVSKPGSTRIVLQANENYHGQAPNVRKIIFTEAGAGGPSPDLVSFDPLQWVMSGGSTPKWEKYRRLEPAENGFSSVILNLNSPLFWEKKVRQALAHLVDRERILNTVLLGYGTPIDSSFSPNNPYYNRNIKPYAYDPRKAQKLLSLVGWEDRDGDGAREKGSLKMSFKLLVEDDWDTGLKMAAVIGEDMKRAGINVTLVKVKSNVLIARLRHSAFEAALLRMSTTSYTDPYQLWHSSQAGLGYNFPRFVNAEADYLLERARLEDKAAMRTKYYKRLQEIIHEEAPAIFLFSHQALMAVSARLEGSALLPFYYTGPQKR